MSRLGADAPLAIKMASTQEDFRMNVRFLILALFLGFVVACVRGQRTSHERRSEISRRHFVACLTNLQLVFDGPEVESVARL